ncbi:nidogen-like domain-containing protein [Methylotuvimicrobium alcaliphilum]|uniref:Uncharacterized protein n=1 Tax=Methylotuvimicrobium alcaliphilum (strain DSM 19304 / NCIMB 14124 / VKM B-2133 / 20Z) TaxID=1091494 RepID=G4T2U3_META2|nr:nidogen-like domain-containing protein [Methylotuvimicrobium alcaliphilum]CCE22577.1 conserved exported protein of unknown function [Methylotuvimicrobium alcaliphilum 20Z]
MKKTAYKGISASLLAASLIFPQIETAEAAAIRNADLFTTELARNDDDSAGPVAIGFDINFFGQNFSSLFVNNNGNVTFDSALSVYTPFSLLSTSTPMLAPFFADVDTRNLASDVVRYGQATIDGRSVFGVNWIDVGFYNEQADPLNSFQLIMTDRSDIAAGDFDFEFNYDQILWETGEFSGGNSSGLGGNSARAGYSNGVDVAYEIAGSAINGALLDGNQETGLINNRLNSDIDGRYVFQVRNGQVVDPTQVPEPETLALVALGLFGFVVAKRRKILN